MYLKSLESEFVCLVDFPKSIIKLAFVRDEVFVFKSQLTDIFIVKMLHLISEQMIKCGKF